MSRDHGFNLEASRDRERESHHELHIEVVVCLPD